jgi:hypothetical protein
MKIVHVLPVVIVPLLLACGAVTTVAMPTPTLPSPASTAPSPAEAVPPAPLATATTSALASIPEAILITEPGPGSRLVSPLHLAGIADPTFEQTLVIRIVLDDGTVLAGPTPVTIGTDVGQRGPFGADIPFTLTGERNALIQVYAESARDGGVTHLASVGVTLSGPGPASIVAASEHPEQITILSAATGGGVAHVQGFGLATFEQTLLVQVYDAGGTLVGSQSVIVQAPDLGQPGSFTAEVPFTVAAAGPGRVVVRDVSPANGADVHVASIEVTLQP